MSERHAMLTPGRGSWEAPAHRVNLYAEPLNQIGKPAPLSLEEFSAHIAYLEDAVRTEAAPQSTPVNASGIKHDSGKPPMDLLDPLAIGYAARAVRHLPALETGVVNLAIQEVMLLSVSDDHAEHCERIDLALAALLGHFSVARLQTITDIDFDRFESIKAGDPIPFHHLDAGSLEGVAKVLAFGAKKYNAHNWRGGIVYSRLIAAALRHLFAFQDGHTFDDETGLSHLSHAGCCLMFLSNMMRTRPDLDDRYKPNVAG